MLMNDEELPQKCKPHKLSGNWSGYTECHIDQDWLSVRKCFILFYTKLGGGLYDFDKRFSYEDKGFLLPNLPSRQD